MSHDCCNNEHTGRVRYETLITNGRLGKEIKIIIFHLFWIEHFIKISKKENKHTTHIQNTLFP